jgi:uncharacterized protein (TIGR00251 family)
VTKTTLQIKVIPNSSTNKIAGKFLDQNGLEYYKINIVATPQDGRANQELIKFLSQHFKIPKSKITILRGEKNRIKIVEITEN